MNLFFLVNLIILLNFILCITFFVLSANFPNIAWLKVLKFSFEASLIGGIADSYAVFGLFYKLGPHTQILLKKKNLLIEKIKLFVGEFLFDKEFLEEELEKIDINLLEYVNDMNIQNKLQKVVFKNLEKYKIPKQIIKIIAYEIVDKIFNLVIKSDSFSSKLNKKGKDIIKKIIIENHNLIIDLIEKRLKEIDDKDFIRIIKQASWDELQWIRLNGAILGGLIGMLIGILNIYL